MPPGTGVPSGQFAEPHAAIASISSGSALEHELLVEPWDVEIEQLAPAPGRGRVDALRTPSVAIYEERWPWQARVRGSNPQEYIVIGAHLEWDKSPLSWCSVDLGPRALATAAPASEVDFAVPAGSRHAVVLVTPQFLEQGLGRQASEHLCAGYKLETSRRAGLEFGRHILRVVRRYHRLPQDLSRPLEAWSIESDLVDVLIQCTRGLALSPEPGGRSGRSRAVDSALGYADRHQGRTTARELALVSGVSQRTLEHAFRERFGITPGVFLRLKRLNGAHRELLASDPLRTTVWQIASNWGFSHQGRFGVLHRRVFEELPVQALRRSRPLSRRSLSDVLALQAG